MSRIVTSCMSHSNSVIRGSCCPGSVVPSHLDSAPQPAHRRCAPSSSLSSLVGAGGDRARGIWALTGLCLTLARKAQIDSPPFCLVGPGRLFGSSHERLFPWLSEGTDFPQSLPGR